MDHTLKLLYISPFFFPEEISTGKWNTVVCQELAKNHSVTVFCFHPYYPDWIIREDHSKLPGLNIIRSGGKIKFPKNTYLRRLVFEVGFYLEFRKHINTTNQFDKAIVVFPPNLVVYALKKRLLVKEITGIVHDLQWVHINSGNGVARKLIARLVKKIEDATIKQCDKLIFLSDEMKRNSGLEFHDANENQNSHLAHSGSVQTSPVLFKSVDVCYPFLTIDTFEDSGALKHLLPIAKGKTHVVYSGALGRKQAPKKIAELLQALTASRQGIYCHIFSGGAEYSRLKSRYQNTDLQFHELVPSDQLPELLLRSDIQLIVQKEGTSGGSLPSKLPNILASGSKLFVITDEGSELAELLKDIHGVVVSTTWDVTDNVALLNKLNDAYDCDSPENAKAVQNKQYLLERFKLSTTIESLLN